MTHDARHGPGTLAERIARLRDLDEGAIEAALRDYFRGGPYPESRASGAMTHIRPHLRVHEEVVTVITDLEARTAGYEEALADYRRLVRKLDVALNGEEGAAEQASLCDLVHPVRSLRARVAELEADLAMLGGTYRLDQPEGRRTKEDELRACYALLFNQLNPVMEKNAELERKLAVAREVIARYFSARDANLAACIDAMNGATISFLVHPKQHDTLPAELQAIEGLREALALLNPPDGETPQGEL